MKKIGLVMMFGMFALTLSGCGDPSKEDVCGGCGDMLKAGCEAGWDICDEAGEGECFDALEDVYADMC